MPVAARERPFSSRHGAQQRAVDVNVSLVELQRLPAASGNHWDETHREPGLEESGAWVQRAIEELGPKSASAYLMSQGLMVRVEQLLPEIFVVLRRIAAAEEHYVDELCSDVLRAAPAWLARGRPAWRTASGTFLIQALHKEEAGYLCDISKRLVGHLERTQGSFLGTPVGLYDAGRRLLGGFTHVVVMRSPFVLTGLRMDYLYELDGTTQDRYARRTGVQAQLLYDGNFLEEQQVVMLPRETQRVVCSTLAADIAFLRFIESLGYKLILAIRKVSEDGRGDGGAGPPPPRAGGLGEGYRGCRVNQEPVAFYFGLVGWLHRWNASKLTRYVMRRTFLASQVGYWFNKECPEAYGLRLQGFLEDRMLPITESHLQSGCSVDDFRKMRPRSSTGAAQYNTLAILAAAEEQDRCSPAPLRDVARWMAVLDSLEAGKWAKGLWRELGLLEERGLSQFVTSMRQDGATRQLPLFTGNEEQVKKPHGLALSKIGMLVKSVDQVRTLRNVGGALVGESSTKYSLALAIAVGVEAATNCTARLAERGKELLAQYPRLHRRPAAHAAKRMYVLPEEGSWLSPPHMLPDLQFVEHAPEIFREIRISAGMDDDAYIRCVCQRDFSFIEFTTNSKSGEFFFFTHDGRCMVKTISPKEGEALVHMLQRGYVEHLQKPEGSLLTKIYGLYQVKLPWFNNGNARCFIVQENLLYGCGSVTEKFDLKGSTFGRSAQRQESVQKDNDWIERGYHFELARETEQRIQRQHQSDCEFLARCKVIDYSVLVFICEKKTGPDGEGEASSTRLQVRRAATPRVSMFVASKPHSAYWTRLRKEIVRQAPEVDGAHGPFHAEIETCHYYMGIIDFLIPWSWKKRAEYAFRILQCQANSASVNPPNRYARRQIEFFKSIL